MGVCLATTVTCYLRSAHHLHRITLPGVEGCRRNSPAKELSHNDFDRTSRAPLKTKFSDSYTRLLEGRQPWLEEDGISGFSSVGSLTNEATTRPAVSRTKSSGKSNAGPRTRYFADLLCLPVETRLVAQQLEAVSPETLLDDDPHSKGAHITDNIGSLWREAIRVWRESDEDEVRRRTPSTPWSLSPIPSSTNDSPTTLSPSSPSLQLAWTRRTTSSLFWSTRSTTRCVEVI